MSSKAKRPKSSMNGSAPVISAPLDALGDTGTAEIVAQMLRRLRAQAVETQMTMVANGHGENDVIPGAPLGPNGEVPYYGTRLTELQDAYDRLVAVNAPIMDDVERVLRVMHKREREQVATEAAGEED